VLSHGKYSDLTSEQYELLGRAFIEWSNIEFLLGILLSRLLFTPEFLGRTYSDEMTASKLESAIKNALDIHKKRYSESIITETQHEKITQVLVKAASCRTLRNKFAHYVWMRRSDEEIYGAKMSGKLPKANKSNGSMIISLNQLKENYSTAHLLVEDLQKIIFDIPSVKEERNLTKKINVDI